MMKYDRFVSNDIDFLVRRGPTDWMEILNQIVSLVDPEKKGNVAWSFFFFGGFVMKRNFPLSS